MANEHTEPILEGITVLELTTGIPGAYCGRLLAMLGADVIKVESAARPDQSRLTGPFPADAPDRKASGAYRYLHAQKRSLSLDVMTPTGMGLLRQLAATADVLLDDGALGAPSVAASRYNTLMRENPRLIVNAFSPYGLDGPRADYVATELTELASGGWLYTGNPDVEPTMPGSPVAQYGTGTFGAMGVLIALTARQRYGFGQLVETPSNESILSLMAFPTAFAAFTGVNMPRMGDGYPFMVVACADGHVGVSILTQRHWDGLCRLMEREDLLTNPRFLTGGNRAQPGVPAELFELIAAWAADKPAQQTFDRAQAMRVPVAIIPSPAEVLASAQYAARDYWVDYIDEELGALRVPGAPFILSGGGLAPFAAAHQFGEDTAAILGAAGVDAKTQVELSAMGVI